MTKELLLAVCLHLVAVLVRGEPEYRAECVVFQNITERLMYKNNVPMNCQKNGQCTGYDCTSEFTYRGPLTLNREFTEDFCFGMALHPCDRPLSMSFYVENPNKTETFQRKITGDASFQLPGVHYTVSSIVTANGYVDITMEPQKYGGYNYVEIGIEYKTKISGPFGIENIPDDLAFQLMPKTLIPVPPCDERVKTDLHPPGTCRAFVAPTRSPGFTTVNPPIQGPNCTIGKADSCPNHEICKTPASGGKEGNCVCTPGYYRVSYMCVVHPDMKPMPIKSCSPGDSQSCDSHQICQQKGNRSGICECMAGFKWDGSNCEGTGATTVVNIIGEPDFGKYSSGSSGSSSGNFKIIIPVVAGVTVAILVIAGVVFLKYRRYKARYGQHSLLEADDDDDRNDGDDQLMEA